MDRGRQADMRRIERVLNDPNKSAWAKTQAGRARQNIINQSRDPQLRQMRERMIRATQAGDRTAMRDMEARIKRQQNEVFEDYE